MIDLPCFYHDITLQPKAHQSWTEASKTESPSKPFLFIRWLSWVLAIVMESRLIEAMGYYGSIKEGQLTQTWSRVLGRPSANKTWKKSKQYVTWLGLKRLMSVEAERGCPRKGPGMKQSTLKVARSLSMG